MLLINKAYNTIMNNALNRLENSPIGKSSKGEIARLLLAIFNEEFAKSPESNTDGFYDILQKEIVQCVLSSSEGENLDKIGYMMDCERTAEEDDDRYRWRISMQLRNLTTANEMAVRLACLSVEGVDDVIMKPYTHGTGSGSIYVVNSDPVELDNLIEKVQDATSKARAWGNKIEVFKPRLLEVAIKIRVVFYKKAEEIDQKAIKSTIKVEIEKYLNSSNVGEELDIAWIKEMAAKTSNTIAEVQIYYLTINQEPVLAVKQQCAWNQRFVQSSEPDSVMVS